MAGEGRGLRDEGGWCGQAGMARGITFRIH